MFNGDCNGIYTRLLRLCGFGDKCIYMGIVKIIVTGGKICNKFEMKFVAL
jgi:hypothetical protein